MKIKAYTLNAFAKTAAGGNPAGVVINNHNLSDNDMKKIAAKLGLSETAFVLRSDCADFKVRFFTPKEAIDLCGHATVGTFSALTSLGIIKPGLYTQETKAGIFNVEVRSDLSIMMNQRVPGFYEIINRSEIADSLNITTGAITADLPVQIVSTGLRDILVPVKNIKILDSINPDFKKIAAISRKYQVTGYHVFSLESLNHSNAQCRNFAPLVEIPEESATGTSSGALACYLFKYGKVNAIAANHLVFEQGYSMKKPSEIIVSLGIEDNEIIEVKVGGKALTLTEIEVEF
ncbi:PhzF family phenazine biosynthesis protein [Acetobacterium sp.]|uniref:PhzF family phenazine biosynthesis protein n=1 Tax=Acetobacterium sp. TaxID=1872094 RepID=UPI002F3EDF6F